MKLRKSDGAPLMQVLFRRDSDTNIKEPTLESAHAVDDERLIIKQQQRLQTNLTFRFRLGSAPEEALYL